MKSQDKTKDFSQRSGRYRRQYLDNVEALYGHAPRSSPKHVSRTAPKPKAPATPTEWQEQASLIRWARGQRLYLIAIPNAGRRSVWQGQRERAAGLTAGVSDLFLAMPNQRFHGFWIEMKRKGGKPTDLQLDWLIAMRKVGYRAECFDDWEAAKREIEIYLLAS